MLFSGTRCREYHVDPQVALLNHYRSECTGALSRGQCEAMRANLTLDVAVERFREVILRRMELV